MKTRTKTLATLLSAAALCLFMNCSSQKNTISQQDPLAKKIAEISKLEEKGPSYVLTISAEAYIQSVGKSLTDYNFRLVSGEAGYCGEQVYESALARITRSGIEFGAEAIIDVHPYGCYSEYLMGTAMIPRREAGK